jgi:hypothetical protein
MLNALNMFDSAPITTGFELGAKLGAVNSPFTPLGNALKNVVDKYDAHMEKQREYAAKQQMLDLGGNKALETEKWKYGMTNPQAEALVNWDADPSRPENQVKIGDVTMVYQPVWDKYGRKIGKKLINPRAPTMYDMFGGMGGGGTLPAADDLEKQQFDQDFQKIQALLES